jgi:hypothetical protein
MGRDTIVLIGNQFDYERVIIHRTQALDSVGEAALRLIERFGLMAADTDGEDSAGRQKGKLMPPSEVVQRCFDIAEMFLIEAIKRDHIVDVPVPQKTRERA